MNKMETNSNSTKKISLEELSKDDLIKKCKNLITIAQKAKQAKDSLQEDNNKLQNQLTATLKDADAKTELIENLTQQKLSYVTHIKETETTTNHLKDKLQNYHTKIIKLAKNIKIIKDDKNLILTSFKDYTEQVKLWKIKLEKFAQNFTEQTNKLEKENYMLREQLEAHKTDDEKSKDIENTQKLLDDIAVLKRELEHTKSREKCLMDKSSEEILKLVEENNQLKQENALIKSTPAKESNEISIQTDEIPNGESEELVITLKHENAEMLAEMNEMNQVLKERGEAISNLQAHKDEMVKKLQNYKTQINKHTEMLEEKEETIRQLAKEIEDLHKNVQEETMSTSTISRNEELNMLRDLEGSWEEKYNKLKSLAMKMKAKIKELTTKTNEEIDEKTKLQEEYNRLQTIYTETNNKLIHLDRNKNELSQDVRETIQKLEKELDEMRKDKSHTEQWKKQVGAKVQVLRKEMEQKDTKINQLTSDLDTKISALENEISQHKQTKNALDQLNNEVKKRSVIDLEMENCEKSVKELSIKLEKKQEEVAQLKTQLNTQKSTIQSLKEQIKTLEDKLEMDLEELNVSATKQASLQMKINDQNDQISLKDDEMQKLLQNLEDVRAEKEEIASELSKNLAENQKIIANLKNEKEMLRNQTFNLQQELRENLDVLKLKKDELANLENEYKNYKVRAQSVLWQNQNRDVGLEEKLKIEIATLNANIDVIKLELNDYKEKLEKIGELNEELKNEKDDVMNKYQELFNKDEDLKNLYDQLCTKYQQTIDEHRETVKNLKIHADTLSQCYRQQLSEQEVRHNREIMELQGKLDKTALPPEPLPTHLPSMPREEGEGSESREIIKNSPQQPLPLEQLLENSDFEQEYSYIRQQLHEQGTKVTHLTALLADTEQDLAKHVQMNKVLKEEIRRQQRSVEREQHAENLEYLKNVVFKFVTLNGGDERIRLVPVLNTILKLSPEETQKLNAVAKGEVTKGWTNYLPTWST